MDETGRILVIQPVRGTRSTCGRLRSELALLGELLELLEKLSDCLLVLLAELLPDLLVRRAIRLVLAIRRKSLELVGQHGQQIVDLIVDDGSLAVRAPVLSCTHILTSITLCVPCIPDDKQISKPHAMPTRARSRRSMASWPWVHM